MTPLVGVALIGLLTIVLYAILGGADFGGGVWDLLATGPRRTAQRDAVSHAIGPVWEANHVWLIFAIVTMFTCFPLAFADIASNLSAPLSFALVGIVLRGAAFIFRNHAKVASHLAQTWTAVFGIASLLTPFWLGDSVGALATGRYAWLSPFALSVGLFALVACAQIAAVFLTDEVQDGPLRNDFRRRAIGATFALWIAGAIPALIARFAEPGLFAALVTPLAAIAITCAILLGLVVALALQRGARQFARIAVGAEALAILAGWFGAQAPALVPGRITLADAAASDAMLTAFLIAAAAGGVFLIPSLVLLFAVFKGPRSSA